MSCAQSRDAYSLNDIKIFDDITTRFSSADVPLVHKVVPMLIQLEERLENLRDSEDLPKIIHIAAIASLLVVEKYSKLSELSEVYRIAMGTKFALYLVFADSFCPSYVSR